jgi:large conductance mechanosensitive channel
MRGVLADLRAFLGRYTVIELLVAFVLAGAIVSFVGGIVYGLVLTPIEESASDFGGNGPLDFVIKGRVFRTEQIVASGVTLGLLVLVVAFLVRWQADVLWQDEGEVVKCPHCLSEIPAEARVCAACTRDVGTPELG